MKRFLTTPVLLIVCIIVLVVGVLPVIQYRWSARVAAADAQREREHLESSSTLFTTKFNAMALRAVESIQNDAWNAYRSGEPLTNVPRLVQELYLLDFSDAGAHAKRLNEAGLFVAADAPAWIPQRCSSRALANPTALILPVYDLRLTANAPAQGMQVLQAFGHTVDRCFAARINEAYVRDELAPGLIRQSFGDSAVRDYDFSIVSRGKDGTVLYGSRVKPDLAKAFFSTIPTRLRPPLPSDGNQKNRIFIQRFESTVVTRAGPDSPDLYGDGIWELDIAHKGVPLATAFERLRWRNFVLGLSVDIVLVAALLFLAISVRRMQLLAEQKMQFIAAVSHELRTPVSSISMLSKNQADGLISGADRVKQYGELIHQESRRLSDMVEQTLEYAGMHSGLGRKNDNGLDVRAVINEAIDARRPEFARRNIEVEVAVPAELPPVSGNAKLLRIAMDNLLSNAEKHAGRGNWMRITARHSRSDKAILISVEDRGPGIDPEDQAEIFEPFSRGPAAVAAQIPGSGLGLSLVRSVAEAHRGTVTVDSAPGRGSTFTLHLPL